MRALSSDFEHTDNKYRGKISPHEKFPGICIEFGKEYKFVESELKCGVVGGLMG